MGGRGGLQEARAGRIFLFLRCRNSWICLVISSLSVIEKAVIYQTVAWSPLRMRALRGGKMRTGRIGISAGLATIVGLPIVLAGALTAPASAAQAPITIAFVTDLSGLGAAEN